MWDKNLFDRDMSPIGVRLLIGDKRCSMTTNNMSGGKRISTHNPHLAKPSTMYQGKIKTLLEVFILKAYLLSTLA